MSLLREIEITAADKNGDLSVLLRKCKILAARLGNMQFKKWIDNELNGYDDLENLPDYRIVVVSSKGNFIVPEREILVSGEILEQSAAMLERPEEMNIPLENIPERLRGGLSHLFLHQPLCSMHALLKNAEDSIARELWNPSIVSSVSQDLHPGLLCLQAWKVIPAVEITAIFDTIRVKILNFAIEIETEAPDAGEAPANTNPVPQNRLQEIFNRYVIINS